MRVWYPQPHSQEILALLQTLVLGHDVAEDPHPETEFLIDGRPERADLERCPNLKWLAIPFAGVPHPTLELVRDFPQISLHNLHHNAPHTAETALALLFAAAKHTVPVDQALRNNDWGARFNPESSELLAGKTAVILGHGEIGKRIGAVLRAMDMSVLALRRHPSSRDEFGPDQLNDLLPQAQVLIIALPHSPETEGLIGAAQLNALPNGAILINIARGKIVDEEALYLALKSGKLHSAGLDVWYRYPRWSLSSEGAPLGSPANTPPSDFPFGELANVVMSPHRGGLTAGTEEHRVQHLAELINAAGEGAPVPNKVNLQLGY